MSANRRNRNNNYPFASTEKRIYVPEKLIYYSFDFYFFFYVIFVVILCIIFFFHFLFGLEYNIAINCTKLGMNNDKSNKIMCKRAKFCADDVVFIVLSVLDAMIFLRFFSLFLIFYFDIFFLVFEDILYVIDLLLVFIILI